MIARFIAIMNITPAVITPGASGESSQPNLAPLSASKAAGVLRENNYQPVFHHLVPEIDLRGLTQVEAHVRMIKMRARLGEYNCRIHNLRKLSPDDPTLPETRMSVLKEKHNIVQFIQILETTTGIFMFFTADAYIPPKPTPDTPITVITSP